MTGTADTEALSLADLWLRCGGYTHKCTMVRKDANDLIYLSMEEKFEAILKDIISIRDQGAPILVGTAIDTSETLSKYLSEKNIDHKVLNAKFHEKEAQIIAQAGRPVR